MATNLVSLVMQFLTPDMIGRIASALGLDRNNGLYIRRTEVPRSQPKPRQFGGNMFIQVLAQGRGRT